MAANGFSAADGAAPGGWDTTTDWFCAGTGAINPADGPPAVDRASAAAGRNASRIVLRLKGAAADGEMALPDRPGREKMLGSCGYADAGAIADSKARLVVGVPVGATPGSGWDEMAAAAGPGAGLDACVPGLGIRVPPGTSSEEMSESSGSAAAGSPNGCGAWLPAGAGAGATPGCTCEETTVKPLW